MADGAAGIETGKQQYVRRLELLKQERMSWIAHWKELSEHLRPRHSRFFDKPQVNRGEKVNSSIINGTPLTARRTTEAGMMSGITSPARPWFRYTTPDARVAEGEAAKAWLREVEEIVREAFQKSNVYEALHLVYSDLITIGTSAFLLEADDKTLMRAYVFPVGQYSLANSDRLVVDTCYREFKMTVRQMVQRFGLEACSKSVQSMWASKATETWIDIVHAIEPNGTYREGAIGPNGKAWKSCWFEAGGDESKLLRESGYDSFPIMAPRWALTGEDVYGYSPGMDVLGDCKQLQLTEKRGLQAFDKVVSPPMTGPAALLTKGRASLLPGEVTAIDVTTVGQRFQPAMEINPAALQAFAVKIDTLERRIERGLYSDLWLLLTQADGQMTATEVNERREEKLLQLGTVLERLHNDLLSPLHERAFAILLDAGRIPKPPDELRGTELRIEYLSNMAQAQKLTGILAIQRFVTMAGQTVHVAPTIMDKVDTDQVMDEVAAMLGVPPGVVRTDEEVAAIREERAKAQQAQQQAEQATVAAQGAKTLSETDTQGSNALTDIMRSLGQR